MQSSVTYCIHHCSDWGRIQISLNTQKTPHLALTDELFGVFSEYFEENWLRYDSTALYYARVDQLYIYLSGCGRLFVDNDEILAKYRMSFNDINP